MKTYKIGLYLIFVGFIIFIIFGFLGIAKVGIFFIFPFIISNNALSVIPALIVFIGFILLFTSPLHDTANNDYNNEPDQNVNNYNKDSAEKKIKFRWPCNDRTNTNNIW